MQGGVVAPTEIVRACGRTANPLRIDPPVRMAYTQPSGDSRSGGHVPERNGEFVTFAPEGASRMTIAASRAQSVAEILWELKRAEKLASLSSIAERAGFSPGSGGRTVSTCLKVVRRDWPHLQWWRAIADDGILDKEQELCLVQAGFAVTLQDGDEVAIVPRADQLMTWEEPETAQNEGLS